MFYTVLKLSNVALFTYREPCASTKKEFSLVIDPPQHGTNALTQSTRGIDSQRWSVYLFSHRQMRKHKLISGDRFWLNIPVDELDFLCVTVQMLGILEILQTRKFKVHLTSFKFHFPFNQNILVPILDSPGSILIKAPSAAQWSTELKLEALD